MTSNLAKRLVCALVALGATGVHAHEFGVSSIDWNGLNTVGCGQCHSGGVAPTVSLRDSAGNPVSSLALQRGASMGLTFRVQSNAALQVRAGFNVASESSVVAVGIASDPAVRTITGTGGRLEVTHNAPKAAVAQVTDFGFTATAAVGTACGSQLTLHGWGNSVNYNGVETGDFYAPANLAVRITCENGAACTAANQCSSGACVDGFCCNSTCGQSCDACSAALTGMADGTCATTRAGGPGAPTSCSPYLCDGASTGCPNSCSQDADCASGFTCIAAACVPKRAVGASCQTAGNCSSGFCADGVCCSSACAGSCDVCALALGSSADGTCGPAPAGVAGSPSCAPFVCSGATTCPLTCSADGECQAGRYCSAGGCLLQRSDGAVCSLDHECSSGTCVDGVCCGSACAGSCEVCAASLGATADGVCTKVLGAGSPSCSPYSCGGVTANCPSSCTSDLGCAAGFFCGAGTCQPQRALGAACSAPDQCGSGFCASGECCNRACAGGCEACGAGGACATLASGASSAACGPYLCQGAVTCPTSCGVSTQCGGGTVCIGASCTGPQPNGNSCTFASQCLSNFCVDGFCCNSACNGACNACSVATGASTNGSCASVSGAGNPSCAPYLCRAAGSGCPTTCTLSSQCAPGAVCVGGQCAPLKGPGGSCGAGFECVSGFCSDAVCCDSACSGSCDVCATGLGAVASGTCTAIAGTGGTPSCGGYLCDGTSASCPTTCTLASDCAASYYCGQGTCRPQLSNGAVCSSVEQCSSGFCSDNRCCGAACSDSCNVCAAALGASADGVCTNKAGTAGAPSCAPYLCGGSGACDSSCALDAQCVGGNFCNAGHCVPKQPLGSACASTAQCASGHCIDGTCCDRGCGAQCEACNLSGKEGTCSPTRGNPVGTRPACAGESGVCAGVCDGVAQTCVYPGAETSCRPATCVAAVATLAAHCNATGSCPALQVQSCAKGCAASRCEGSTCAVDSDCATGRYCSAGVCAETFGPGEACSANLQCASRRCVDGVCCNRVCAGSCEACDLPGSVGTCSAVLVGPPRGGRPACEGLGACAGRCDGTLLSCRNPEPTVERCNGLDDDCDGVVDNAAPCPAGELCDQGRCIPNPKDCGCSSAGEGLLWLTPWALALALRRRRARQRK